MVFKKGHTLNNGRTASIATKLKMSAIHKNPYPKIPILCKCGCGETVWNCENEYIWHHVNIMLCASLEYRNWLSKAHRGVGKGKDNPFYGQKHTLKTKERIKAAKKGNIPWNRGKTYKAEYLSAEKNPMYGVRGERHPHWKGGKKMATIRHRLIRKWKLGYFPLNSPFEGLAGHHVTKTIVIFIPLYIHTKIWHSLDRPDTMVRINEIAFNFLFRGV